MSQEKQFSKPVWNIFAYGLQSVLSQHGLNFTHLHSIASIDEEKVHRISESLNTPPDIPNLDPEEQDRLIRKVHLNEHDIQVLEAAMYASIVQRMLCSLIDQEHVTEAAQALFPIILKSLEEHPTGEDDTTRGDGEAREDSRIDRRLRAVEDAIYRGNELLTLLKTASKTLSYERQQELVRNAEASFSTAFRLLERSGCDSRQYNRCAKDIQRCLNQVKSWKNHLGI